jgi:ABC-2 type transport system permease protein
VLSLERTAVVARHNFVLIAGEPGPAISRIILPLVIVPVLRPLYTAALDGEAGTIQAVSGLLVMFSLLGLSAVGATVLTERAWRTLDRLRATPARPAELLIGKALPVLLLILLQQVLVLTLGVLVLDLRVGSYPLLILAIVVWSLTLLCVGTAVATLVRSYAELSVVVDVGAIAFAILGGALIPLQVMPDWARPLAPASPGYWAMRGLQGGLAGEAGTTLTSIAVLASIAALGGFIAGRRLNRGWGRSRLL